VQRKLLGTCASRVLYEEKVVEHLLVTRVARRESCEEKVFNYWRLLSFLDLEAEGMAKHCTFSTFTVR
jgi:hypothetical protein